MRDTVNPGIIFIDLEKTTRVSVSTTTRVVAAHCQLSSALIIRLLLL
jgi:hypothetical protein